MPTSSSRRAASPRQMSFDAFKAACQDYTSRRRDEGPSYAAGWIWRQHAMVPTLGHMRRSFELPLPEENGDTGAAQDDDDNDAVLASMATPVEHQDDDGAAVAMHSATPSHTSTRLMHVDQMVLYSSTWKVPVLYLRAYARQGEGGAVSPLPMEELLKSPPFLGPANTSTSLTALLENNNGAERGGSNGAGEGAAAAYFPPISLCSSPLGDDDGSGEPWQLQLVPWLYLHPCQTAQMVGEMLAAAEGESKGSEEEDQRQYGARDESGQGTREEVRYLEAFLAICASAVEMRGGTDGVTA